jgi:hypothetical protein
MILRICQDHRLSQTKKFVPFQDYKKSPVAILLQIACGFGNNTENLWTGWAKKAEKGSKTVESGGFRGSKGPIEPV